jgi:hypothetical protein
VCVIIEVLMVLCQLQSNSRLFSKRVIFIPVCHTVANIPVLRGYVGVSVSAMKSVKLSFNLLTVNGLTILYKAS